MKLKKILNEKKKRGSDKWINNESRWNWHRSCTCSGRMEREEDKLFMRGKNIIDVGYFISRKHTRTHARSLLDFLLALNGQTGSFSEEKEHSITYRNAFKCTTPTHTHTHTCPAGPRCWGLFSGCFQERRLGKNTHQAHIPFRTQKQLPQRIYCQDGNDLLSHWPGLHI